MCILIFLYIKKIILERKGVERERERNIDVPLIDIFIGWLLYVPWPGIESTALEYQYDALTNWATWPGSVFFFK